MLFVQPCFRIMSLCRDEIQLTCEPITDHRVSKISPEGTGNRSNDRQDVIDSESTKNDYEKNDQTRA